MSNQSNPSIQSSPKCEEIRQAFAAACAAGEQPLAEEFLAEQPLREFALAMFNLNAFLYVG